MLTKRPTDTRQDGKCSCPSISFGINGARAQDRYQETRELNLYRWRKEYGGLQVEQARRLKDLEKENTRLRRLVSDLSLEKQVLKDIARGNL